MDTELAVMLGVTRRLPRVRGAGVIANVIKRIYLRKPRPPVEVDSRGFRMRLEPAECIDGEVLFFPQIYDHHELAFIESCLEPGDTFLDVGANIGVYSLAASARVGNTGSVLAIEADPYNHEKLTLHLRLNGADNVRALHLGVADRRERLRLGINATGNRGGNSFLRGENAVGVDVECHPLLDVLRQEGVGRVAGAKLDIEGMEYRVLHRFFETAPRELFPGFLVLESNPYFGEEAGGDPVQLALSVGYRSVWSSALNHILVIG